MQDEQWMSQMGIKQQRQERIDRFAEAALTGLLPARPRDDYDDIVRNAYDLAEEMEEERSRRLPK